jgi:hypothetical protein
VRNRNLWTLSTSLDALTYEDFASDEVEKSHILYPCSGESSKEGTVEAENSIGLLQALFRIQRMIELDLRV